MPVGGGHAPEAKRQPERLLEISTLAEVAGKAASYEGSPARSPPTIVRCCFQPRA